MFTGRITSVRKENDSHVSININTGHCPDCSPRSTSHKAIKELPIKNFPPNYNSHAFLYLTCVSFRWRGCCRSSFGAKNKRLYSQCKYTRIKMKKAQTLTLLSMTMSIFCCFLKHHQPHITASITRDSRSKVAPPMCFLAIFKQSQHQTRSSFRSYLKQRLEVTSPLSLLPITDILA